MFRALHQAFNPTPHAHVIGPGKTIHIDEMSQRELDRLDDKINAMVKVLEEAALAANPQVSACGDLPNKVMGALINDFFVWFYLANPDQLVEDVEMQNVPKLMQGLPEILRNLPPLDAQLVRDGLCQSRQLWDMLCKLSPSLDLNPKGERTPQYEAMRIRYLGWINTISRELPAPSAQPSPPPITPRLSPLLRSVSKEIATPQQWRGLGGEIAPHLIPRLKGWPAGRQLHIQSDAGTSLDRFGETKTPPHAPVVLQLNTGEGHYSAVINGRKAPVPGGGDCFYRAILVALGEKDRQTLLKSLGADLNDPFGDDAIARLRKAASLELESDPTYFTPRLELLQIAEQASKA